MPECDWPEMTKSEKGKGSRPAIIQPHTDSTRTVFTIVPRRAGKCKRNTRRAAVHKAAVLEATFRTPSVAQPARDEGWAASGRPPTALNGRNQDHPGPSPIRGGLLPSFQPAFTNRACQDCLATDDTWSVLSIRLQQNGPRLSGNPHFPHGSLAGQRALRWGKSDSN